MRRTALLALLLVAPVAHAQSAGPGVSASVRVTTTQDSETELWTYTYEVSSAETSARSIDFFRIDTLSRGALRNVQTPSGWEFSVNPTQGSVAWSTDAEGVEIEPGRSLGGFSFDSTQAPGANRFSVSGHEPAAAELYFSGATMSPSTPCAHGSDPDGDTACSPADNCPNAANPDQQDQGGVATPADPEGQTPDGIGDACQCGDTDGDGRVSEADAATLRACLDGGPPCNGAFALLPGGLKKCDVGGPDDCEASDVATLRRAIAGSGEPVRNACIAFRGALR